MATSSAQWRVRPTPLVHRSGGRELHDPLCERVSERQRGHLDRDRLEHHLDLRRRPERHVELLGLRQRSELLGRHDRPDVFLDGDGHHGPGHLQRGQHLLGRNGHQLHAELRGGQRHGEQGDLDRDRLEHHLDLRLGAADPDTGLLGLRQQPERHEPDHPADLHLLGHGHHSGGH